MRKEKQGGYVVCTIFLLFTLYFYSQPMGLVIFLCKKTRVSACFWPHESPRLSALADSWSFGRLSKSSRFFIENISLKALTAAKARGFCRSWVAKQLSDVKKILFIISKMWGLAVTTKTWLIWRPRALMIVQNYKLSNCGTKYRKIIIHWFLQKGMKYCKCE